eukprot:PhM_4_TR5439/c0_g1_i1/m.17583
MIDDSVWYLGILYFSLFYPTDCAFAMLLRAFQSDHIATSSQEMAQQQQQQGRCADTVLSYGTYLCPVVCLLQVAAYDSFKWSFFTMPPLIGCTVLLLGLAGAIAYVVRCLRVLRMVEVSRGQWVALSWFRLDALCIAAACALVGWGNWLLALLIFALDVYYAQQLLLAERVMMCHQQADPLLSKQNGVADASMTSNV